MKQFKTMKSKKMSISDLQVKSFVTTFGNANYLETNLLKGGTSEDTTVYTGHIATACVWEYKP